MRFYSDIAYLVCISTVILAYMDFSVCASVGDPNCGEILVCVFTGHMRADLHFLRVFSGDTIGSLSCSVPSMHIYVVSAYICLLYTSPSPRDLSTSRMPSSA